MQKPNKKSTSWEPISKWYGQNVGDSGHYYHQHVVIPKSMGLLKLQKDSSILDLACGQGVLARHLPTTLPYLGIDISTSLIKEAKQQQRSQHHEFLVGDVTKPLALEPERKFSHATIVLALQNIEQPDLVFQNAYKALIPKGKLLIVLNHPCFRIPRQSSWEVDQAKKLQYRRIDRYGSAMQIPIQAHPSQGERSATTWSFHHPLATYSQWLCEAGFQISLIDEWYSNKVSTGAAAKMENRSREEIPLFLALLCESSRDNDI